MSREIAYMLDTNILYEWLYSYIPQNKKNDSYFNPERASRIRQFMEHNENAIYIPDLVWSEFLGVTLHKDMDISNDLGQLKLRFRLLLGVIQQMEMVIQNNPQINIFSAQSENFTSSAFCNAAELATDIDLIDQNMFLWLKGKKPERTTEKFLDGMDAVIVSYLDNLAANHPEKRIMLYTGDFRIFRGFSRIRSYWKRNGFSQNTGAICSLFTSVRTRNKITHSSDVLILADVKELGLL